MTLSSVVVALSPKSQDRCDLASLCFIGSKNTATEERNSVSQLIWEEDPHPKAIIFLAWKLKGKEADKEGKHRLMATSHGGGV